MNTEIAESPVMIRLSAIPPYPPVSCKLFELGGGIQKPWRRRNSLPPSMFQLLAGTHSPPGEWEAGYAGGITSAAVDGIRVSEAVASK